MATKSFSKLKGRLERHFLTEEKAIFSLANQQNQYDGIPNLIQQHNLMLEILNDIENKIFAGKKFDITKLKAILKPHRIIEEGILYPRFDVELDNLKKQFIIKKIKKNNY